MKKHLLILFSTLYLCNQAQAQWGLEFPEDLRNTRTYAVNPPGSDLIYLFGNDMMIFDTGSNLLTRNDNYTGSFVFVDESSTVLAPRRNINIYFASEQLGFVVSNDRIYRTRNGGNLWEVILELPSGPGFFTDVYFVNDHVGYAVGSYGRVYKTTDGGDTWEDKAGNWSTVTAPWVRFSEVIFKNETEGMVVGYQADDPASNIGRFKAIIQKTTDGGDTWQEIQVLPGPGESDHHYAILKPVSVDTVYLSISNRDFFWPSDLLMRSTDGGLTWEELPMPFGFNNRVLIRDMHWFDENHGIIAGNEGSILGGEVENDVFITTDGGLNWQKQSLPVWPHLSVSRPIKSAFYSMVFKGDEAIIAGGGGSIIHTEDQGASWQSLVFAYPDLKAIDMVDYAQGFTTGSSGLILRKNGNTWDTLSSPVSSVTYEKVVFRDANNGAIMDWAGQVYLTDDAGDSWSPVFEGMDSLALDLLYENGNLYMLTKIDRSQLALMKTPGIGSGLEGTIIDPNIPLNSNNNGQVQVTAAGEWFVYFLDNLYTSGDEVTWSVTNTPEASSFRSDFLLVNESDGLLTDGLSIWLTNDSGQSWTESTLPGEIPGSSLYGINGFAVLDKDAGPEVMAIGWTVPADGSQKRDVLLTSGDLGQSWSVVHSHFTAETGVFGIEGWDTVDSTLYLASTGGMIYTYGTTPEILADTLPPSVPPNLAANNITTTGVDLSWEAATDNVGVTAYLIYQDNVLEETVNTTGTTISGLEASTTYTFAVTARDAAGNESAASTIQVTTEVILSVAEAPLGNEPLRVYPNPSTDEIVIAGKFKPVSQVQIARADGRVYTKNLVREGSVSKVAVQDLPAGMYVICIEGACERFIKVR